MDWAKTPDGRSLFATEGPEESGLVTLRDATTGAVRRSWRGHEVDVNDVAFSDDGSMLATTGDDGLLKVWRTADRQLIAEVRGEGPVYGPSFSPDGIARRCGLARRGHRPGARPLERGRQRPDGPGR